MLDQLDDAAQHKDLNNFITSLAVDSSNNHNFVVLVVTSDKALAGTILKMNGGTKIVPVVGLFPDEDPPRWTKEMLATHIRRKGKAWRHVFEINEKLSDEEIEWS